MTIESELDTLRRDVQELKDRAAILDCIRAILEDVIVTTSTSLARHITTMPSTSTDLRRIGVHNTENGRTARMPRHRQSTPTTSRRTRARFEKTRPTPKAT